MRDRRTVRSPNYELSDLEAVGLNLELSVSMVNQPRGDPFNVQDDDSESDPNLII